MLAQVLAVRGRVDRRRSSPTMARCHGAGQSIAGVAGSLNLLFVFPTIRKNKKPLINPNIAVVGARKNCGFSGSSGSTDGKPIKNSQAGQVTNMPTAL
jgi:hypothetical protein